MKINTLVLGSLFLAAPAMVSGEEMPTFAMQGTGIAYSNIPNRDPIMIDQSADSSVSSLTVNTKAKKGTDVMVTFTSGIAVDTSEGCPCSVRAMLQLDEEEPIVIKRINIGSPAVQEVNKYEQDRQPVVGS
ncbi:hypothetical protein GCM10011349_44320 [Novosphingobium indicum]|uniref:Uncharacterized protein n=2 Tax=Novosphingobium indicum TaxID=462949 RepID=A0ABQ2K320_9SPHN|nr:hypothetical protein GCM10011349_44320 [Novosphingobium indicum]